MSTIKVNTITTKSGSTLTLGESGKTITLATGASQSGFKEIDWQTGDIKTSTFTAVAGKGYFVNTTGGAITCNLPAGSVGDTIGLVDYANKFGTNALTINANGSDKVGGDNASDPTLNVDGTNATFIYVDSTRGWITTSNSQNKHPEASSFIVATGGCISYSGNYKIHTFNSPGTFAIPGISATAPYNVVDYLMIAGGAGGGTGEVNHTSGGGGAGGYRESPGSGTGYTASPLGASPMAAVTAVACASYPITIGAGGAGAPSSRNAQGVSGSATTFNSLTSAGGGGGGSEGNGTAPARPGAPGGSGGGGSSQTGGPGGTGNTPPVSPPQGQNGATGVDSPPDYRGGGGGGAGGAGTQGTSPGIGGKGGVGVSSEITGSSVGYAGGGNAGGTQAPVNPNGPQAATNPASPFGGGIGGTSPGTNAGGNGGTNKGGGGGGGQNCNSGGTGGSGVVIIRYRYQ